MWSRGELKERGMAAFKANYWKCVLVALILAMISGGGGGGGARAGSSFSGVGDYSDNDSQIESDYDTDDDDSMIEEFRDDIDDFRNDPKKIAGVIAVLAFVGVVVIIVMVIAFAITTFLLNPLEIGCRKFFVRNLDDPSTELNCLSAGFDTNYKNVVKVMFLRMLYLFLWFLIPIAGPIIMIVKSYEYMMIPYLLADDPNMSREEAFAASKEMMDGQKWNAFVLGLSFIGWYLLSILTCGILAIFYVSPYVASTFAALYETLRYGYNRGAVVDNTYY